MTQIDEEEKKKLFIQYAAFVAKSLIQCLDVAKTIGVSAECALFAIRKTLQEMINDPTSSP